MDIVDAGKTHVKGFVHRVHNVHAVHCLAKLNGANCRSQGRAMRFRTSVEAVLVDVIR